MFQYDDDLLTEMIWAKYVEALEANARLEAQLKVAEVTVVRLQEVLDLKEDANEDNNYLIPQTPNLGVVPDDE